MRFSRKWVRRLIPFGPLTSRKGGRPLTCLLREHLRPESGILHVSLERLALHYGMIDMDRMAALRQDAADERANRDFLEFIDVFATTAVGTEMNAIGRFLAAAQKRFPKFVQEA